MRDGKVLAGDLYTVEISVKKPVILIQTPYDKSMYWKNFAAQIPFDITFYQIVILDWRGRFASKKAAVTKANLGFDGYDAIEWIAKQSWCNGKIGTYGGSALGQVQFETAAQNPPHLVCAIPMIKDIGMAYETYYFGGEYRKEHTEALQTLQFLSTDVVLSQPRYNKFWKAIEKNQDLSSKIHVPMLLISGWFDHYPDLVIASFANLQTNSDPKVRNLHKLILGPWQHMTVGESQQGILTFANAAGFASFESIRFMNYYLLGKSNGWNQTENIQYYQMGEERWLTAKEWKKVPRLDFPLYLQPGGKMDTRIPKVTRSSSTYLYDSTDPTPSFGGDRFTPGKVTISGPQDQREKIESRKDVILFTSGILVNNLPITGLVQAELYISSDKPDTDFSVRLCDVYPDGKSVLLAEGIQRARFRNSLEIEEFLHNGETVKVTVKLQNIAHTFLKGHQIRAIISSASYPIFDRNPNNAETLYKSKNFLTALNTIYYDVSHSSRLLLLRRK
jgi:putative CocE/NonD family hydrolase